MSGENKTIVSVKDLVIGVKNDENNGGDFRFRIDYGTFDVCEGDFVLIKGRNGSGKSTFLRLFHLQNVNYFKVVGGEILFKERGFPDKSIHLYSTDELTRLNCMTSYIGQEEKFLTFDSAYSFIYNSCRIALEYDYALSRKEKRLRLEEVDRIIYDYYEKYLAFGFGCKSYKTFKNKNVHSWSGGQQKMINVLAGIIKAEVCKLKLVIMDEPLNNLDGRNKDVLNRLVADLRKNRIAVIAITHCQIFGGVNKILTISESEDGTKKATLAEKNDPPHSECLEPFQR